MGDVVAPGEEEDARVVLLPVRDDEDELDGHEDEEEAVAVHPGCAQPVGEGRVETKEEGHPKSSQP